MQTDFQGRILILGFGCVGSSLLPLLIDFFNINKDQITIIDKSGENFEIAKEYGIVNIEEVEITEENYLDHISFLAEEDFLVNVSTGISSIALIEYCQKHSIFYIDTCTEPWEGTYDNPDLSIYERSNYKLRLDALDLKRNGTTTALICHGANPGLVSHLVKQALINIAGELRIEYEEPQTQEDWANLSKRLNIQTIHIAERDTQKTKEVKKDYEFQNTWSVDGFISEGIQPAELGWGSHELWTPERSHLIERKDKRALIIEEPGINIRLQTWTPLAGRFQGFLVTHNEAISISEYLTIKDYSPTCHYAYHPCDAAVASWDYLIGKNYDDEAIEEQILMDNIGEGIDELGVLLMGHEKGAYWFGSQLSIDEARKLVKHNNATSMQVNITIIAGMLWCLQNPKASIIESDEIDYKFILDIAKPYLGNVEGFFSDFKPRVNPLFNAPEKETYAFRNFLI